MATNGVDYDLCADLSLLTTSKDYLIRPFSTIWATSAATAQAAGMAAQIFAEYPGIWPETVVCPSCSFLRGGLVKWKNNLHRPKETSGVAEI